MKFYFHKQLFLMILLVSFVACDSEDVPEEPQMPEVGTVTSESQTVTTFTSVKITGTISENEDEITSYGVVWGKTSNPTLSDNISLPENNSAQATERKSRSKSQNNSFTVEITKLTPGETYYFRTFATNKAGTAYGEELIIGTPTLAETSWEITFDQNTEYPYLAHVTFYSNGTVYTDFKNPDLSDFWGAWNMESNLLTYQVHDDYDDIYILTGEIEENRTSGSYYVYSEGAIEERTFTGNFMYSVEGAAKRQQAQ